MSDRSGSADAIEGVMTGTDPSYDPRVAQVFVNLRAAYPEVELTPSAELRALLERGTHPERVVSVVVRRTRLRKLATAAASIGTVALCTGGLAAAHALPAPIERAIAHLGIGSSSHSDSPAHHDPVIGTSMLSVGSPNSGAGASGSSNPEAAGGGAPGNGRAPSSPGASCGGGTTTSMPRTARVQPATVCRTGSSSPASTPSDEGAGPSSTDTAPPDSSTTDPGSTTTTGGTNPGHDGGNANGAANGNANGATNGNGNGAANGNGNGATNGNGNGAANGSGNGSGKPNGNANGNANGNSGTVTPTTKAPKANPHSVK